MENETFNYVEYFVALCSDYGSDSNITSEAWYLHEGEVLIGAHVATPFLILFLLIGLPLNLIVAGVIIAKKLHRKPSYLLLLNLGLSDLLLIVTVIPIQLATALTGEYWSVLRNDVAKCMACKSGLVSIVFLFVSLSTISFMSFDRFVFIYRPLRYKKIITFFRVLIFLIVMWILSIILAILPLVGFGHIIFDSLFLSCYYDISGSGSPTNKGFAAFIYLVYGIPVILIVVFNLLVVYMVQKNIRSTYRVRKSFVNTATMKARGRDVYKEVKKKRFNKQLNLIKVFGGLLLTNLLSWLPSILFGLITLFSQNLSIIPYPLYTVSVTLFMMQVAAHPLVEIALLKEVKNPIKAFFCCYRCRAKVAVEDNSAAKPEMQLKFCTCCHCWDLINDALAQNYDSKGANDVTTMETDIDATDEPIDNK